MSAPTPTDGRPSGDRPPPGDRRADDSGAIEAPSRGEAVEDILSADDIFRRVAATADDEFRRAPSNLIFSGIAAGISIGITFLARAALTARVGGEAASLPGDLLYPLGFVIVVLGRYQLFTENTLTPVTLVLTRLASIPALLRLWGLVIIGNLIGAALAAALYASGEALDPDIMRIADELSREALEAPLSTLAVRSFMAGGLVASMVWLVHAIREGIGRVVVVYGIMLLIPVAHLYHCITGFCEVLYGVLQGYGTLGQALVFFVVVAVGNIVGGVTLVAFINFGQTSGARFPDRAGPANRLSASELMFGYRTGQERGGRVAPERDRVVDDPPS